MKNLITSLHKLVAAPIVEIQPKEYDKEIEKFFAKSPDLIDILNKQKDMYKQLGGVEHCISTGNVLFRYMENKTKKHIYIVGIISRSGKIKPNDLIDVRSISQLFVDRLIDNWTVFASVNSNSRGMVDRIKKLTEEEGHQVFERSFGRSQFLQSPEFTFDTIAIAINEELLEINFP